MAPSFDCAVASLLCAEDNSVFDDDDCYGTVEEASDARDRRGRCGTDGFDAADVLPMQSDACLAMMLEREHGHLPARDYLERMRTGDLDFEARDQAVEWISKVHAHFAFGPLCAYLSVNYLDRFLSAHELPRGKGWTMQLLAVACLSLAAKMEETDVPLSLDLQVGESRFVFEARIIQRMELLVLSTLKWRMQAVTPFTFIDCFIRKINDDQLPPRSSISRSIQLILSTVRGIDFLEFKPSEVAAAVAISALGEIKTVDTEKAVAVLSQHVEKGRVVRCLEMIHDLEVVAAAVKGGNGSELTVPPPPQSPIGVLDAACFSYRSGDTAVGSCANSARSTPEPKRRKMNIPCKVEL